MSGFQFPNYGNPSHSFRTNEQEARWRQLSLLSPQDPTAQHYPAPDVHQASCNQRASREGGVDSSYLCQFDSNAWDLRKRKIVVSPWEKPLHQVHEPKMKQHLSANPSPMGFKFRASWMAREVSPEEVPLLRFTTWSCLDQEASLPSWG